MPPGTIDVDVEIAAAAAAEAEAAIDAHDWAGASAAARDVLATDLQTFLPDCDGPWVAECRRELETVRVRALEVLAEAGLRQGGRELGTAEQAARAAVAAMPFRESVAPAADGGPRGGREPGRGAARLRGAAHPAARRARHHPGRGGDGRARAAPARRGARRPGPRAARRQDHGGRLAGAARRRARPPRARRPRARARRARGVLGRGGVRHRASSSCCPATPASARPAWPPSSAAARATTARWCSTGASTRRRSRPTSRWSRWCAAGRRAPRSTRCASVSACAPPSSGSCSASSARRPPTTAPPTATACASSTRWPRCSARPARTAPLVLVFDDLHWADRPTLQLLRHLVRSPQPRRALLLGTYREAELEPGHALHELIADVRRDGMLKHLALTGLAEPEVAELVSALGVPGAEPAFVHALHGETDGNPFFIEEVVRHLRESDHALEADISLAEAGVPDGVREVTARRLRRLDAESRQALQVAAVIGREFDYDVLQAVAPLEEDALISALEEGVEARVLREAGRVGRYAFTHALVRATLVRRALAAAPRAAARPRRRGDRAPARRRPRSAPAAARLPLRAGGAGRAARARDRLRARRRAPRRPPARLGGGRPALPRRAASARADRRLRGPGARRAAARAGRLRGPRRHGGGGADHVPDRGSDRARAAATRRCSAARRSASPASGRCSGASTRPGWRCSRRRWTALGDEDSPLRARLLARLALELYYSGDPERRLALSEQAVDLARRLGDPRTLATCLDARHYALWRPENVNERLEVAAELRRVAEQTGDPELELEGAGWTVVDLLELGDVQGADIQIAAASKLAEALQRPIWRWWTSLLRCTRAQLDGRFDEAEQLADEALEIGRHGQAENAVNAYWQAMFNIRREQGRLAEVEPSVRRFIDLYPMLKAWRAALALLLVELGRVDEARDGVRGAGGRRHAARRELADRRDAAGRGVRRAGRRRAGRAAVRAARALRGPQRRRGPRGDVQRRRLAAARHAGRRRCARGSWPRGTSSTRWRCTSGWARGRGWRAPSSPTPRCCWRAAGAATRRGRASCSPTPSLTADALGMGVRRAAGAGSGAGGRGRLRGA